MDETSFVIGDCGRYSMRGKRINVPVSKTLRREKCTKAITSNGILHHEVIQGYYNKSRFLEFINSLLMDNGNHYLWLVGRPAVVPSCGPAIACDLSCRTEEQLAACQPRSLPRRRFVHPDAVMLPDGRRVSRQSAGCAELAELQLFQGD